MMKQEKFHTILFGFALGAVMLSAMLGLTSFITFLYLDLCKSAPGQLWP